MFERLSPPTSTPSTCTPGFAASRNCRARATAAPSAARRTTTRRASPRFMPTVKQRRRRGLRYVAYRASVELRDLPSVDELARDHPDPLAVPAAREVLARAREEIRGGFDP